MNSVRHRSFCTDSAEADHHRSEEIMNKDSYRVIRILLVPKVVGLIAETFGWDEIKACTAFYNSKLNEQLEQDDNDLWTYSEYKLLELFKKEIII